MDRAFKDHITFITDEIYEFPYRYGNEIYYSKIARPEYTPVEYESNFSIKFMFSGSEKYLVNDRWKKVTEGKMLIVNNQSHVINQAQSSEAFSVFLTNEVIDDCSQYLNESATNLLGNPFGEKEQSLNFYDHVLDRNIPVLESLKLKLDQNPDVIVPIDFYYEIANNLLTSQIAVFNHIEQVNKLKFSTRKEIYRRVILAHDYLRSNLYSKFCLDNLAKACYMSKFQLIKSFKQVFGMTPHRYFILEKMRLAYCNIQEEPGINVQDIAFKFGYPSLASFSKQFKQIYGTSPNHLRRSL